MTWPTASEPEDRAPPAPADALRPVYDRAVAFFRSGTQGGSTWFPIVLYAGIVAVSFGAGPGSQLNTIMTVVGAMLFRDLGRWAGIHLLGYPDRELLLLPFFRVALPAEGDRVEQWKKGLIILLGPLPGLVLGFVLVVTTLAAGTPALRHAAMLLALVNVIMLVPLRAFDGGRLLSVVLFSRYRHVELAFALLTAGALVWAGARFHAPAYLLVAVFTLLPLKARFQVAGAAAAFGGRHPGLPRRASDVGWDALADLFRTAGGLVAAPLQAKAQRGDLSAAPLYAGMMRQVHEAAVVVPPSWQVSLLLLGLYGSGLVLGAVTLGVAVLASGR